MHHGILVCIWSKVPHFRHEGRACARRKSANVGDSEASCFVLQDRRQHHRGHLERRHSVGEDRFWHSRQPHRLHLNTLLRQRCPHLVWSSRRNRTAYVSGEHVELALQGNIIDVGLPDELTTRAKLTWKSKHISHQLGITEHIKCPTNKYEISNHLSASVKPHLHYTNKRKYILWQNDIIIQIRRFQSSKHNNAQKKRDIKLLLKWFVLAIGSW